MHRGLQRNAVDDSVVYKTINIFRPDHEFFSFLVSLTSSKPAEIAFGRFSRYMWCSVVVYCVTVMRTRE